MTGFMADYLKQKTILIIQKLEETDAGIQLILTEVTKTVL